MRHPGVHRYAAAILVVSLPAICLAQASVDAVLAPAGLTINDFFGTEIAVDGPYLIVGVDGADVGANNTGAVYVFRRSGPGVWVEEALLSAADPRAGARFASSADISGETAVVGRASNSNPTTSVRGAAYVFDRSAAGVWSQTQKLVASDSHAADWFGADVSISGDVILAGAPQNPGVGDRRGAAYVFQRQLDGTWAEQARLTASDGDPFEYFGISVATNGDLAVIGAPLDKLDGSPDPNNPIPLGSAFVYRNTGGVWSEEAKLQPDYFADPNTITTFNGWNVAVSGERVVSRPNGQSAPPRARVYSADSGEWTEIEAIVGELGDHSSFGGSLDLEGPFAFIEVTAWTAALYRAEGDHWQRLDETPQQFDDDPNDPLPITALGYGDGFAVVGYATADEGRGRAVVYDYRGCSADLDGSGVVDLADLSTLLANYGLIERSFAQGDITGDGVVSLDDLSAILGHYSRSCP